MLLKWYCIHGEYDPKGPPCPSHSLIRCCFLSCFFFLFHCPHHLLHLCWPRADTSHMLSTKFTEDYLFVQLGFFRSNVLVSLSLFYSDMERKCLVTIVNSAGYLITNTQHRTFSLRPFLCSKADH